MKNIPSSKLIQPLICTAAVSSLTNTVTEEYDAGVEHEYLPLPSPANSLSRFFRVALTSFPLLAADVTAIAIAYSLATATTHALTDTVRYSNTIANLSALAMCYVAIGTFQDLFPASGMNPVRELRNQLTSIAVALLVLIALNGIVGRITLDEILVIAGAFPAAVVLAPIARFGARRGCARWDWWGERVIIVGSTQQGLLVHKFLKNHPQRGLKPLGVVDQSPSEYWQLNDNHEIDFLGTTNDLLSIARKMHCHWVIAAIAGREPEDVRKILTQGSLIPNLVVLNASIMMPTMWVNTFDAAGLTGIHIRDRVLFPFQRFFKRLADIVLSAILLVLCLPLYLAIYAWIRSSSDGPVLFCHDRIGRSGNPFGAWKFRSMVTDAPDVLKQHLANNPAAKAEWDQFHKLKDDPRIIPGLGQFLRRTSMDELPQLWNVLKGDMSLVGPRPVYTREEIDMYGDLYPLYLRLRPGLTGLWQVSGRNNTTFADKVQLDTYYAMNWSLWLDYFILLRTIRTVIFREGSY